MIILEARDLQWVKGEDDPTDQCAHGRVHFQVNNTEFVVPTAGLWTVSASALYLLRTLTENHTHENPVAEGNLLFPCCGFNVWDCGTRFKVMAMGCPSGVDPEVVHDKDTVTIRSSSGSESVSLAEWRTAVVQFVESVSSFYKSSTPKIEIADDYDRQGWLAFWLEWKDRYTKETSASA